MFQELYGNAMRIRKERPADYQAIRQVTELAFQGKEYAGGDEQDVIDRLRATNALTLSYVAIANATIVGHIAFSPAAAEDRSAPWFALGPVSVLPERQRKGIGSALIYNGLSELEKTGALGCILTGSPTFYRKFGFELKPEHAPANEPKEYFMVKLFTSFEPTGAFCFHSAFYG
ncbi:MAG: N-acetyltransferase [Cyanobacteria bacterium J06614_10]